MNRKHRKLRHKRRQLVHVNQDDKRMVILMDALDKSKAQRKGRKGVIKFMHAQGYYLPDDSIHTDHTDYRNWARFPESLKDSDIFMDNVR